MSKFERQIEREAAQYEEAVEAFLSREDDKRRQDRVQDTTEGRALHRAGAQAMLKAVDEAFEANSGRRGRPKSWYALLRDVEITPRGLTNLGLRGAIRAALGSYGMQYYAHELGKNVAHSILMERFRRTNSSNFNAAREAAKGAHGEYAVNNLLRRRAEYAGVTGPDWDDEDKLHVGYLLLGLACESSPMVEWKNVPVKTAGADGRPTWVSRREIALTAEGQEFAEDVNAEALSNAFRFRPMIVPPREWTETRDGGYLVDERVPMVRNVGPAIESRFNEDHPELMFDSVNVAQSVAHRVSPMLAVLENELENWGPSWNDAPSMELPDLTVGRPAMYTSADWEKLNDVAKQAHRDMKAAYDAQMNAREEARAKRNNVLSSITEAARDRDEDELYFVHSMDWRTRQYPLTAGLDPQGNKAAKALLEAAHGQELTAEGVEHVEVTLATLYGCDKLCWDERHAWFVQNFFAILETAANPADPEGMWREADDALGFLQLAIDYLGFVKARLEGEPYTFRTPIARDGTNNVMQHTSTLLLDESTGPKVNLTGSDEPADIYGMVQSRAQDVLDGMDQSNPQVAEWNQDERLTRKAAKIPGMTYGYGSMPGGMSDDIRSGNMPWTTIANQEDKKAVWSSAMFMAQLLYDATEAEIGLTKNYRDFMQGVSDICIDSGVPVSWVTPAGAYIEQRYFAPKFDDAHETWIGNEKRRLYIPSDDVTKPSKKENRLGVCANFVHSMDTVHLGLVVTRLRELGVEYIRIIHDSVAVLPNDVDLLDEVLRECWIEMYEGYDWLSDFEQHARNKLAGNDKALKRLDDLVALRDRGNLDVNEVLESPYFFH